MLVNPHVQTVQNMYGKGGKRVYKAELWPLKVDPYFEKKITVGGVTKKLKGCSKCTEKNPLRRILL